MVFTRLHRRWTAWLAVCAILLGALAPTVSHGMRAWAHAPITWVEVCSSTGNKLIAVTMGEHAGDGLPSGEHAGEHCPFCLVPDHDAVLLPAWPCMLALSTPVASELPFLFLHAPRGLFAWAPSQARAPPTSV